MLTSASRYKFLEASSTTEKKQNSSLSCTLMKLLIIEDELVLLEELDAYLRKQGHLCERAATFLEAEDKIALFDYEMFILDITLPGGCGLTQAD